MRVGVDALAGDKCGVVTASGGFGVADSGGVAAGVGDDPASRGVVAVD